MQSIYSPSLFPESPVLKLPAALNLPQAFLSPPLTKPSKHTFLITLFPWRLSPHSFPSGSSSGGERIL